MILAGSGRRVNQLRNGSIAATHPQSLRLSLRRCGHDQGVRTGGDRRGARVGGRGVAPAQTGKPSGTKSVTHDITVNADAVYSGTTESSIIGRQGDRESSLTVPTEIIGKVSGTSKAGARDASTSRPP